MVFIEASAFTKYLRSYLNDDEYRELQNYLIKHPDAGDLIQETAGLRKMRWTALGKGKRSGVRVIYYWQVNEDQIYLLTLYGKNEMSDLSARDKKILKQLVERWKL